MDTEANHELAEGKHETKKYFLVRPTSKAAWSDGDFPTSWGKISVSPPIAIGAHLLLDADFKPIATYLS